MSARIPEALGELVRWLTIDGRQHACEEDTGGINEPLNDLTQAIERLEGEENDPKPDRLDSIHDELVGLQEDGEERSSSSSRTQSGDEEGEIREHLRRARDHVRAYRENADELSEE